jgi:non-ribosomal peptide synthase protein (TIGR01720 family)
VAYVVVEEGTGPRELRAHLAERLPGYMVPAAFVMLPALPLNASGKVDRRALPAPSQTSDEVAAEFVAAQGEVESVLARIWARALRVERVGVHDNFFELGGDSIMSLQIVAAANEAGLPLTARDMFQHQTISALAAGIETRRGEGPEQGIVTGDVPLTPIQHDFFGQDLADPHHFNQAVLLETREPLDPSRLDAVLHHLVTHHDSLRMRFTRDGLEWRQVNEGADARVSLEVLDIADLDSVAQDARFQVEAARVQGSLDLISGPILRALLVKRGPTRSDQLLLVAHHLVIDGVSWRALLTDLQSAYEQLTRGEAVRFPAKSVSFRAWSQRLQERASAGAFREELDYWRAVAETAVADLPRDRSDGENLMASARSVRVELDADATRALLTQVPKPYNTQINDALLTALVRAFARWTGEPRLFFDLEGHGRESSLADLNVARTVGWFTSLFPVALDVQSAADPTQALVAVKEQLRRIPSRGVGYGVLRYLSTDGEVAAVLRKMPSPPLAFNYLGQFDEDRDGETPLLRPGVGSVGPTRSARQVRRHQIEINGSVVGGKLTTTWTYSENLHDRSTIEGLAQGYHDELRELIAQCVSVSGGFTPSDFPEARLDQKALDRLLARI